MLITDGGVIIRTRVSEIPVYGRSASGVRVMRLDGESRVVRFAVVDPAAEAEESAAPAASENEAEAPAPESAPEATEEQ